MEKLFSSLNDEKLFLIISGFISLYSALFAIMITLRRSRRHRNKSAKEKAYELILKGNEQQTLNSKALFLIYKREIARKFEYISYVDFLETFLIYVRDKDVDGNLTNEITAIIDPILEKEKTEKPYSNVEEKERRILLAIEKSANNGETSSILSNLSDLSIAIESNQRALKSARTTNRWTIPISIAGVLLTIFIWIYGSSLSDRDVQRISNQIYTTISDSLQTADSNNIAK